MLPYKSHLKDILRIKNPTQSRYGWLRLDKNENTIPLPEEIVAKIKSFVNAEFLMVYPEIDPLYEKVAKWLNCEINNLYLSSGSDGAIKTVFEAFVQKDDKVMLLDPTYAMFYVYIKLFEAKFIPISYESDLSLNTDRILNQIKQECPKLICIANPNSPTGSMLSSKDIEQIIVIAASVNSVVLIDEAYWLYLPDTAVPLISKYPNLVVTRSFSKAIGLAAARLGLAVGHPEMIECLHKWRPMYETNAFAVKASDIVLDHFDLLQKMAQEVIATRDFVEAELKRRNLGFHKSYANFINIRVGSKERAANILKSLNQDKILVSASFNFEPLKDCIRVSIGNREQMETFFASFDKALKKTE